MAEGGGGVEYVHRFPEYRMAKACPDGSASASREMLIPDAFPPQGEGKETHKEGMEDWNHAIDKATEKNHDFQGKT